MADLGELKICNQALHLVGIKQALTSLQDTEIYEARLCSQFYARCRDFSQWSHPWNCCSFRASLAKLADAPAWGYDCQFELPTNPFCLRVLQMDEPEYQFKVEGRALLTDEAEANILYVGRVEQTGLWSPGLADVVSLRLAWMLAFPLTKDPAVVANSYKLYLDALREARSLDGLEGSNDRLRATSWVNARG